MKRRGVLILYQSSLLAEGLLTLLSQEDRLDVRAEKFSEHLANRGGNHFEPDVIIVDRDELAGQNAITIGDLLSRRPGTRVIDVSVRDTSVRLYEEREVSEADFQDLLATIDGSGPTKSGSIPPRAVPKATRRENQGGKE